MTSHKQQLLIQRVGVLQVGGNFKEKVTTVGGVRQGGRSQGKTGGLAKREEPREELKVWLATNQTFNHPGSHYLKVGGAHLSKVNSR